MTKLAEDNLRVFESGIFPMWNDLPVVASDVIYGGAAVGDNGSGYARPLESGDPFRGFASHQADNASGSAGDEDVRLRQIGIVKLSVVGASAVTDVGSTVYATDDDTFTLSSGGSEIGRVVRWVSGTTCLVFFQAEQVRNLLSPEVVVATSGSLDHASFTDNADATGKIDTGIDIPAQSLLLGFEINVTEAFDGDTTAVADLGDGTDADLYNGANQPDVSSIAAVGVGADPSASYVASATDLTLTVEGGSDWGNITAGACEVSVAYVTF